LLFLEDDADEISRFRFRGVREIREFEESFGFPSAGSRDILWDELEDLYAANLPAACVDFALLGGSGAEFPLKGLN